MTANMLRSWKALLPITVIGLVTVMYFVKSNLTLSSNTHKKKIEHAHVTPGFMYEISCTFDIPGLGNQMFQYASLLGIASHNSRIPVMPVDHHLNDVFKLPMKKSNMSRPGINWGKINELKSSSFDKLVYEFTFRHPVEVVGFLQSWMYFRDIQDDVRKHFQFQTRIMEQAQKFISDALHGLKEKLDAKSVALDKVVYIGVHIRRGDYLNQQQTEFGYTVADKAYLLNAIHYYENQFMDRTLLFIVCGNDAKWNKANFQLSSENSHAVFSEDYPDGADLAVLSQCNHTIATVGTFSWWAGWLAGGQVTYYRNFPGKGSRLSRMAFSPHLTDYYPKDWIGIA